MASASAPGVEAEVDDQGESKFCTRFALSKAITQACDYLGVDVSQESIALLLVNEHEDLEGRFATDFNGIEKKITDTTTKKWYKMTIGVQECSLADFKGEGNVKEKFGTFVLDWKLQRGDPEALHCVYALNWKEPQQKVHCLNSWGLEEKEPLLDPGCITEIYRVSLVLVDQKTLDIKRTNPISQPVIHPHTLTVCSDDGPAGTTQSSKMGVYKRINIWPQWTNHDQSETIYYHEGRWCIGKLEDNTCGIKTELTTGLSSVPTHGWMYFTTATGWESDRHLTVSDVQPVYPVEVTFTSSGPAAVKYPTCMGKYTQLPDRQRNKRPIWKHLTTERYLFYADGGWWRIIDNHTVCICSKKKGLVHLPAEWQYADGGVIQDDPSLTIN